MIKISTRFIPQSRGNLEDCSGRGFQNAPLEGVTCSVLHWRKSESNQSFISCLNGCIYRFMQHARENSSVEIAWNNFWVVKGFLGHVKLCICVCMYLCISMCVHLYSFCMIQMLNAHKCTLYHLHLSTIYYSVFCYFSLFNLLYTFYWLLFSLSLLLDFAMM